jgi:hypothetical protein
MNVFGIAISAGAWLAPVAGIAVLGMAATVILLRDHLRLERHAMSLEAEIEHLRTELGRLAGQDRPYGSGGPYGDSSRDGSPA